MARLQCLSILRSVALGSRVCLQLIVIVIAGACLASGNVDGLESRTKLQPIALKNDLDDGEIQRAADALLAFATIPGPQNQYFPQFAKEKIAWLTARVSAGTAAVILLKDISKTHLGADDLMASAVLDGRHTVFISQPRFVQFLREGGRVSPPFGEQQRNDFMLGLVHEVVHLQGARPSGLAGKQELIREESRTWHEVSVNVVRQLRWLGQRMHPKFVRVDEALRSCGDLLPCSPFIGAVFR